MSGVNMEQEQTRGRRRTGASGRGARSPASIGCGWAALAVCVSLALLLSLLDLAGPRALRAAASPLEGGAVQRPATGSSYNNLDNLISDFLDDAGDRLKKSKLNSMRQIKPTLRFGRRSDPLMAPGPADWADRLAALEGRERYELAQRRLLAAALAAES